MKMQSTHIATTIWLVLIALVLGLNSRLHAQDDLAMKVAYKIPLKVACL